MRRAAIYARYSSDLQSPSSIDDQVALCRAYCAREGFAVAQCYDDRALSGGSMAGRAGLDSLLRDAALGHFDVLIVEALDRLSRDMEDLAHLHKRLTNWLRVDIIAVHEGRADAIQVGVRGLVGALYLSDLAHKTRRGLAGKLLKGQRAGGLPFGYRPILGRPGEHVVYEPEAIVVRRIFQSYADGLNPRAIAATLNAEGVAPCRGRAWNASTINGSTKRASGMLSNEVYRGVIVWNRVSKVRNPDTGKRVPRINAKADRQTADAPHLRIVPEHLWVAVATRLEGRRMPDGVGNRTVTRGPQRLLSGLLKCASCGSSMVSAGSSKGRPIAQCTRVRESGDCDNRRRVYLDSLEENVLSGLRDLLREPERVKLYVRTYHEARRRLAVAESADRAGVERRIGEVGRAIERIVNAVADGHATPAMMTKLHELEREKVDLDARLSAMAAPEPVTLHPKALEGYLALLDDLAGTLRAGDAPKAVAAVREMVETITVFPREKGEPAEFELKGRLAALLNPGVGSLVPRGGIEPPTLRFSVACSTN